MIADFLPHGYCMTWKPGLIGLHIVSDSLIALAYFCIPFLLWSFARKRKDIHLNGIFFAFGSFILACGTTHVVDVVTLWFPAYWLAGGLKALTATVSLATAGYLFRLMPQILKLPTPGQMETMKQAELALAHTRDELQHSLARFQATFDNAAIGLAHVAPDGRFLMVNRELCHMVGYTAQEMLELNSASLNHPDDLAASWALANSVLDGTRPSYTLQKRYLHRDGTPIWVALTVSAVRDIEGKVLYLIAATRDIREQKEMDEQRLRTLDSLAQRDQQLSLVFDQGAIGDFSWDIEHDLVTAHPIVWRLYGCPEETGPVPSAWFAERQHPEDAPRINAALQDALSSAAGVFDMEFRVIQPDWSTRWIACRGGVQHNEQGKAIRVVGLNLDVSERKQAEYGIRRQEKLLATLTEEIPLMLWFNDRDGNVEFFNQRWYQYTGQSEAEALNWGWEQAVEPTDLPELLSRWENALDTGMPHEAEFRLRAQDGSYRWHLGRGLPIRDEAGIVVRWFGSLTDIHDLKMAEQKILAFSHELELEVAERTSDLVVANDALVQARTRLQAVMDSATEVAIVALDCQGVIQLFNRGAERMLQYSSGDVQYRHTPALFFTAAEIEERSQQLSASADRLVSSAEIFDCSVLPDYAYTREAQQRRHDGTEITTHLTVTPMLDSDGRRIGTLGISLDITKRKLLELQLIDLTRQLGRKTADAESANRAKSEFLAAMSHEIRTPMNAILGMADLLWDTRLDDTQRHYVQVFRRAGANLLTLVNDILDLSKIESGVFELEEIDFDLRDLVERTIEMIQPRAQAKHITLLPHIIPGTPCNLVGDGSRLQQILINLLGNAVKFTEAGEIALTIHAASENSSRLHFEICDTGIGIPADKLESIFEDFTQAERSTTRRYGGTGLGLGICRRLVNRMGGEINVRSEFGKGSTFYFDAEFKQNFSISPRRQEGVQVLSGLRVLIVDNNATNRLIFSEMCASWGMLTAQCAASSEVSPTLEKGDTAGQKFDLIILERQMPGMDGFELTSHLRSVQVTTPILMASSDNLPGDETRGQSLGISGYTVKPVRRAELLRLICKALGETTVIEEVDAPKLEDQYPGDLKLAVPAHILIAEDSEDNRLLFDAYLTGTCYQVSYAENGQEAVLAAAARTFDLILMDLQMPVMDGLEATRMIRNAEIAAGRPAIPVLAVTANARQEDFDASRLAGCNAHLSKPISKLKLMRAIQEHVGKP